jgi:hypothetical protein
MHLRKCSGWVCRVGHGSDVRKPEADSHKHSANHSRSGLGLDLEGIEKCFAILDAEQRTSDADPIKAAREP